MSSVTGAMLGLLNGVLSNNQISGIANAKGLSLLYLAAPIAATLVPQRRVYVLYWAPT